jgi:hypothetical protein
MSEMWGENKIAIKDVRIRICDAFGQLSHPSPRRVEPDPAHRTAGAAGQHELPFQIGNTKRPFCTVALDSAQPQQSYGAQLYQNGGLWR